MVGANEKAKDFKRLVEQGKLSHAYLFFGGNEQDRMSKYEFALSLANFLERGKFEIPDRPLVELLLIEKEPDKEEIGIDAVRGIPDFLYKKPVFSSFRTVIVRESERLSAEAQAAILKIAEEPPDNALIILILRNESNLFPTLVSRLQRIHFRAARLSPEVKRQIRKSSGFSLEEISYEGKMSEYFESLLLELMSDSVLNWRKLKAVLRRLVLISQFNVNKKLQLRALANDLRPKN